MPTASAAGSLHFATRSLFANHVYKGIPGSCCTAGPSAHAGTRGHDTDAADQRRPWPLCGQASLLRSYARRLVLCCGRRLGSGHTSRATWFSRFTLTRIRSLRCRARAWRSTTVVDHTLTETELRALPESAESRTRQHSDRCAVAFVVARRPAYFASRPSNA